MSSAVVARRAGRREWIGLVAIALPCVLSASAGGRAHRESEGSGSEAWPNTYRQPLRVRTYVSLNQSR